jgi:hypothetical protein
MRFLNDDQLKVVVDKIIKGSSNGEILRIVQRDFGLLSDQDPRKLAGDLIKFKSALLSKEKKNEESDTLPSEIRSKIANLSEKVDGLGRMGWLINVQTERILNIMNKEKMGLPMTIAHTNIKTLGNLLDKYIKVQMELGMLSKDQNETIIETGEGIENVVNIQDSSKNVVIDATRKLLKSIDLRAERFRLKEDGTVEKAPELEKVESIVHRETSS